MIKYLQLEGKMNKKVKENNERRKRNENEKSNENENRRSFSPSPIRKATKNVTFSSHVTNDKVVI